MDKSFRLLPEQGSDIAFQVDVLYYFLVAISLIITLAIAAVIIYFAVKYRRGSNAPRIRYHERSVLLEVAWIVGPFLFMLVLFFWGGWLYLLEATPPHDALEITCVGRQWMWKFQHPDGRAEINNLHVPLNQPVKVKMISDDVIHSLYLPVFRVKQDVLPGRYSTIWFQPSRTGEFHLFCAEYCGTKHSEMRGVLHVMEADRYQEWLAGEGADSGVTRPGTRMFDRMRCGSCHQGGGENSRGPSLQNLYGSIVPLRDGRTEVADDTYIRESILNPAAKIVAGYEPLMPVFEGQISEEGIWQLIREIKAMGAERQAIEEIRRSPAAVRGGPEQIPHREPENPDAYPRMN